jgi:uncharacterized protein YjiS (DUF1127 family)
MTTILTAKVSNIELLNHHNDQFTTSHTPQGGVNSLTKKINATLQLWNNRYLQRRQLATMDHSSLNDMGVNYADVSREIAKPFWVK